jgi:hypothetical protein
MLKQGVTNLYLVEGADLPIIAVAWVDENDAAIDITDYTIVLSVKLLSGETLTIEATVDDPTTGEFTFSWPEGGLAAGTHSAEIIITDADELDLILPQEAPISILVRERV